MKKENNDRKSTNSEENEIKELLKLSNTNLEDQKNWVKLDTTDPLPKILKTNNPLFDRLTAQHEKLLKLNYTKVPRASNFKKLFDYENSLVKGYFDFNFEAGMKSMYITTVTYHNVIYYTRKNILGRFICLIRDQIRICVDRDKRTDLYAQCEDLFDELELIFADALMDDFTSYDIDFLKEIYSHCENLIISVTKFLRVENNEQKMAIGKLIGTTKDLLRSHNFIFAFETEAPNRPHLFEVFEYFTVWALKFIERLDAVSLIYGIK